jgi:peptide/nickel transport system substrate-binding protein
MNYVESVEALNSREVRFNLKQVFAGELQSTNIYPIPKHILGGEDNLQNSNFNVDPVASGPFKLQEWNKGKWIEMIANPDYFRGRPPLDRMVFYTPSSMGELFSELVLGNVDLAYDLPPGNYDTLKSYMKVLSPGRAYTYIGWNMVRFPDKKLREAFSMAIDRRKIISDVLENYGQVVDGPITPEHWAYNPDLKGIREDKEGSKKLIEELGYSKKRGQKFYQGLSVQILVEEGNDIRKRVAATIVSDLQAVGVQATVVPLSGTDLITRLFNKNFDAYILGWNVDKEFNPFPIWGSDGIYNFVGYKNARIDSLIGEALLSLDREKAKKALYEFQEIIRDDLPYTFLYAPKKITLVKKSIQGVAGDDKRPILSFVDELWFRSVSGTGIELASLGESYRKGPEEEKKPIRGERETPEQVLMATAPTLVPEKRATATGGGTGADTMPEESAEPPKFVAYEVPPKPLNLDRVVFPYPEVAKKLGLSGTVYLELWISKEGNVTNVVLIRSVHPILDKVAVENARQLRFSPAIQGNKPVAVRYSFPVRFQE